MPRFSASFDRFVLREVLQFADVEFEAPDDEAAESIAKFLASRPDNIEWKDREVLEEDRDPAMVHMVELDEDQEDDEGV